MKATSFFTLAKKGAINLIAPARATGYDGGSVHLTNGKHIHPKVVLLATGYQSSWDGIISGILQIYNKH